jgi:hypothetical protein
MLTDIKNTVPATAHSNALTATEKGTTPSTPPAPSHMGQRLDNLEAGVAGQAHIASIETLMRSQLL